MLVAAYAMQEPKTEPFSYDAWAAWSSFGVGARVEHEAESVSGRTVVVRTIEKKTEELVTIRVVRKVRVEDKDEEKTELEQVLKPKPGDKPPVEKCLTCGKAHPTDVKESKQKVRVDKLEIDCALLESTVLDCAGKKIGKLRRWYSKEVPGWMVKMETTVDDLRSTTVCLRFTRK
jgi:hypothetical protein